MNSSSKSRGIIRGTTPTLYIVVTGEQLEDSTPYVTIEQPCGVEIIKKGADLIKERGDDYCLLAVPLTQMETLSLQEGRAMMHMRWIDKDGMAGAARNKRSFPVYDVLQEGVITYE